MNKRIRVCANPALTPALSPRRGRIVSRLWREPGARSVDPPSVNVRKAVRRLGLILLGFVSLALCGCASWQRSLIYVPSQDSPARLDALAKAHGIERWKNSAGENIGWRWPARHRPARGQLLVTHGNAGYALQRSYLANPLSEAGALDVFVLEYPGYGDRPGPPTEKAFFKAAEDAFEELPANALTYLIGESLGTGVASYLAGKYPESVSGVLLLAPYNSLVGVAQYHVKVLPAWLILCDRFRSEKYLANYNGPVGILVGDKDQIVPAKFGRKLFDSYKGPKQLWEFPDGDHGSINRQPPEFWNGVVSFWRENEKRE